MDEQAVKRAAEEAVGDLQLDCEIKNVCRSSNGDQWCVQFSGKYGQFCDDFKNQFEKENSPVVAREKIKSHLLKQVTKIRSSTGKSRRGRTDPAAEGEAQSSIMSAPLKMIKDVFDRASEIAGGVVEQVAGVAEVAQETVSGVAESMSPVSLEIRSESRAAAKRSRKSSTSKPARTVKAATPAQAAKKARSVSRKAGKQAKKASKVAAKVSRGKRSAKKSVRRKAGGRK